MEEIKPVEGEQVPELSPVEQRALEMGWKPRSEFDGDESDFVDAKEFVGRKPLFEKLSQQSRKIKNLENAFGALQTHYTTVKETEYNRALAALKAERKTAVSEGDGDKWEALDEEIKTLEAQAESMKTLREQPVAEQPAHPALQTWLAQNPWYTSNSYMRAFAEEKGTQLHRSGMAPEEVLKEVTKLVKKEFPNKFTNPNKESAPNVSEGGKPSKSGGGSLAAVEAGLTEQQRKIMNTLINQRNSKGEPLMTKEQYLKDLQKV